MSSRRYWMMGLGLAVSCALAFALSLVVVMRQHERQIDTLQPKAKAFDGFCQLTKIGVQSDMFALRSKDPKRREAAFNRIFNEQVNHGDMSVRACLGDRMPSSEPWDWCRINEDVECLAKRSETLLKLLKE